MKRFPGLISLLAGLLTLISCSEPLTDESFVRRDEQINGAYEFALDMSDGEFTYDLSFYTIIDGTGVTQLPLSIELVSPSGVRYAEKVTMDVSGTQVDMQLYRSSLVPVEYGIWALRVTPMMDIPQMRGLGLINEKKAVSKKWDTANS